MQLETRYKPNDVVYAMSNDKLIECEVQHVKVEVWQSAPKVARISYNLRHLNNKEVGLTNPIFITRWFAEDAVAASKAALVNKLFNLNLKE